MFNDATMKMMKLFASDEKAFNLAVWFDESVANWRQAEFDWPENPWVTFAAGCGILLGLIWVIYLYVRDTAQLNPFWRFWLLGLRLLVIAAIIVVALNPHTRTEQNAYRPSRVILLVDTSTSMSYPEKEVITASPAESKRTRADAVLELLSETELIDQLCDDHEVSVFTFDQTLSAQPHHVFSMKGARSFGVETPGENPNAEVENASDDENVSGGGAEPPENVKKEEDEIKWKDIITPSGHETRLGEALSDLIRKQVGPTLSGIVVFSDGSNNAGIEPDSINDLAIKSNVRLITVGVGGKDKPVNLQVVALQGPTDVHVGKDVYSLTALIQSQQMVEKGIRDVEVILNRRLDGSGGKPTEFDSQTTVLNQDGVTSEVKFEVLPDEAGVYEYTVEVKPLGKVTELTVDDNIKLKTVKVIERNTSVLLIAGGPTRDYRFVRNMLKRHKSIDIDVWLQSVDVNDLQAVSQEADAPLLAEFPEGFPRRPSADDFQEDDTRPKDYDVVICFDADWSRVDPAGMKLLKDWVDRDAGGVVLVAGEVFTPQLADPDEEWRDLMTLYPVFLQSNLLAVRIDDDDGTQAWPVEMTREGQDAGFLKLGITPDDDANDAWKEFDGFFRAYPTGGEKAGTTVYARYGNPKAEAGFGLPVLFASQFYGSGRCFYIGTTEVWRLRQVSEDVFDRFWINVVREMGQGRLNRGDKHGILLLERNEYILGETVRVRARLMDAKLQPLLVESVPMEVIDPDGRPLTPPPVMMPDPTRAGEYVADFRAGHSGTYRIEMSVPGTREMLEGKLQVTLPQLESISPEQQTRVLSGITRDTGGKYLEISQAKTELVGLLPNRGETIVINEIITFLWDRQWLMYLLIGLMSLEWLSRKLLKLA